MHTFASVVSLLLALLKLYILVTPKGCGVVIVPTSRSTRGGYYNQATFLGGI